MFPFLAKILKTYWGPFRLLGSNLVLLAGGATLAMLLCWWLLPLLWDRLPHDQGKAFVKDSEKARGKPTGSGVIMVPVFLFCALLFVPLSWRAAGHGRR